MFVGSSATQNRVIASKPSSGKVGKSTQFQTQKSISVVGGGFCGVVSICNILKDYSENKLNTPNLPDLTINWFDHKNLFGRGLAYQDQLEVGDRKVFLLNQPANQMSPFPDDVNSFVRWLSQKQLPYDENSFAPRALFGDFLVDTLNSLIEKVGDKISINKLQKKVVDYIPSDEGATLVTEDGINIQSDSCIFALGHNLASGFVHLKNTPGYIQNVRLLDSYRKVCPEESRDSTALLIGGGPTAIDAIRALEHAGFKGQYTIVSSAFGNPWQFDSEKQTEELAKRYKEKGFFALPKDLKFTTEDAQDLGILLRKEVLEAKKAEISPGLVYYGVLDSLVRTRYKEEQDPDKKKVLVNFAKILSFYRGAVMAPDSFELLSKLFNQGRLQRVKGRADVENISYSEDDNQYKVPVIKRYSDNPTLTGDILVSCSQLNRAPTSFGKKVGEAEATNIRDRVVGPQDISGELPKTSGVESYREQVALVAKQALEECYV